MLITWVCFGFTLLCDEIEMEFLMEDSEHVSWTICLRMTELNRTFKWLFLNFLPSTLIFIRSILTQAHGNRHNTKAVRGHEKIDKIFFSLLSYTLEHCSIFLLPKPCISLPLTITRNNLSIQRMCGKSWWKNERKLIKVSVKFCGKFTFLSMLSSNSTNLSFAQQFLRAFSEIFTVLSQWWKFSFHIFRNIIAIFQVEFMIFRIRFT